MRFCRVKMMVLDVLLHALWGMEDGTSVFRPLEGHARPQSTVHVLYKVNLERAHLENEVSTVLR